MAKREEVDAIIARIVENGEKKYILALEYAIEISKIAPPEVLRMILQKEIDKAKEKRDGGKTKRQNV